MNKPKHKTRKKLWWLIFVFPILIYVSINLFFPPETSEFNEISIVMEESSGDEAKVLEEVKETEGLVDAKYWAFIDNCLERLEKIWYLAFSIIAFFIRHKLVGDDK